MCRAQVFRTLWVKTYTIPANANMRTQKEKLVPADNTENTSVLDGIQQPNENERKSCKMLKLSSIDLNAP